MLCRLLLCFCALFVGCISFHVPTSGFCQRSLPTRIQYTLPSSRTAPRVALSKSNEHSMYMPPKYLINVVKSKPGQKITVADLSSVSGVEMISAERDLMNLAHVSGAALQVTEQGDLIYAFPSDIEKTLLRYSVARRFQLFFQKVAPTLSFLFRASFGLCLAASLAVITVALVIATTAGKSTPKDKKEKEKEDKKRREAQQYGNGYGYNGNGYGYRRQPGIVAVIDLADLVRTAIRLAIPRTAKPQLWQQKGQQMGYLDSFFSFVFGDGDPNTDLELQTAAAAAHLIRSSKGVVVAEQLAPLLVAAPASSRSVVDESFVLPLLLRFGGTPSVTPSGNIAYTFPELMVTAGDVSSPQSLLPPTPLLLEKEVPFSSASATQKVLAATLAGVNLAGAMALGTVVKTSAPWVKAVYPVLLSYAVLFTAVPAVRLVVNSVRNARIRSRNARRLDWLRYTATDDKVHRKWLDATAWTQNERTLRTTAEQNIVFDSTVVDKDH